MSLNLGYLIGSSIFAAIFVALVWSQVRVLHFRPARYWAMIVATTTLDTTMATSRTVHWASAILAASQMRPRC